MRGRLRPVAAAACAAPTRRGAAAQAAALGTSTAMQGDAGSISLDGAGQSIALSPPNGGSCRYFRCRGRRSAALGWRMSAALPRCRTDFCLPMAMAACHGVTARASGVCRRRTARGTTIRYPSRSDTRDQNSSTSAGSTGFDGAATTGISARNLIRARPSAGQNSTRRACFPPRLWLSQGNCSRAR